MCDCKYQDSIRNGVVALTGGSVTILQSSGLGSIIKSFGADSGLDLALPMCVDTFIILGLVVAFVGFTLILYGFFGNFVLEIGNFVQFINGSEKSRH